MPGRVPTSWYQDTLAPEEFGGEPAELQAAHAHSKALAELRKLRAAKGGDSDGDDGVKGEKGPKKGGGRGGGQS